MNAVDPYGPTQEQNRSHRPSQPVEPTHGDILAKLVAVENKIETMGERLHVFDVRQWVMIAIGLTMVGCMLVGIMLIAVSPKLPLPAPIGALIQRSSGDSGSASSASSKAAPSPSSPTSATSAPSSSSTPASTLTN